MGFVDWLFDYGDRQFMKDILGDRYWAYVSQKKQSL